VSKDIEFKPWPGPDVDVPDGPPTREEVESIRRFEGRGYVDSCPPWAMVHIERLLQYIDILHKERDEMQQVPT
jgi:hypothetical protein